MTEVACNECISVLGPEGTGEATAAFCSICEDEPAISTSQDLKDLYPDCGHSINFGEKCLREFFSVKIKEHALHGLKCPHPDCINRFSDEFLTRMTSKEDYAIYAADFKSLNAKDKSAFQNSMMVQYCTRIYDAVNESLPNIFRRVCIESKRCPSCRFIIEKNGGCNHMTCCKCGYEFHWCCGQSYRGRHHELICKFFKTGLPFLLYMLPLTTLLLLLRKCTFYFHAIISFFACGFYGCYILKDLTEAIFGQDDVIVQGMRLFDKISEAIFATLDCHCEDFRKKMVALGFLVFFSRMFTSSLHFVGVHNEIIEYFRTLSFHKLSNGKANYEIALIPITCFTVLRGFNFFDLSYVCGKIFFIVGILACNPSTKIFHLALLYCLYSTALDYWNLWDLSHLMRNVSLPIIFLLILIATNVNCFYFWCGLVLSVLQALYDPFFGLTGIPRCCSWMKNNITSTAYFLTVCFLTASAFFVESHSMENRDTVTTFKWLSLSWSLQYIPTLIKLFVLYLFVSIETSAPRLLLHMWNMASSMKALLFETILFCVYGCGFFQSFNWLTSSWQHSFLWLGSNFALDIIVRHCYIQNLYNMPYLHQPINYLYKDDTRLLAYSTFLAAPVLMKALGAIFQIFCICAQSTLVCVSFLASIVYVFYYAYFSYVR